jgi:DNA polymerase-3 subunit beta
MFLGHFAHFILSPPEETTMKFKVNTTELQRALSKVGGAIPSKSTMPVLESFLFDLVNDTLVITATDLEVSLTASLNVQGSEDGRIVVPAKRLQDTVRSFPDIAPTFTIDTTTNKIKIVTDNGEYTLTGENAKEFPALPQFASSEEIRLDTTLLKRIIHRTTFAVSGDELRPAMMGILLQGKGKMLSAVATDGHRLVKVDQQLPSSAVLKRDVIVPARACNLVARSAEGGINTIALSSTHIRFAFDSMQLISRLIDEKYPNYESVIPQDNDKSMTVNREEIITALRRVALYASATTHQIRFDIKQNTLTISAQDLDFGGEARETLSCEYTQEPLEIGFNSGYVTDILTHLDSEKVVFRFSAPTRAGLVAPSVQKEDEDVVMLVMPVRLAT